MPACIPREIAGIAVTAPSLVVSWSTCDLALMQGVRGPPRGAVALVMAVHGRTWTLNTALRTFFFTPTLEHPQTATTPTSPHQRPDTRCRHRCNIRFPTVNPPTAQIDRPPHNLQYSFPIVERKTEQRTVPNNARPRPPLLPPRSANASRQPAADATAGATAAAARHGEA